MAKSLLSAIAAMALAAFAPTAARAVTFYTSYNFDFSSAYVVSSTLDQNTAGNSMTFRSTTDPSLQVKITAWSIEKFESGVTNTADDIVTAATLKMWNGGLGVQNKFEDGSSPNHSIDNGLSTAEGSHRMVDFLYMQFDFDVDINTMTTGWVNTDQDASLRVGTGPTSNPGLWNTTPALDGKNVFGPSGSSTVELSDYVNMSDTSLNSYINDPNNPGTPQTRNVNGGNQHGMVWLIGALYGSDKYDFFKLDLANVKVYPTIPEPSTWMTMILGFGFVGGVMRRRRASLSKASASLA